MDDALSREPEDPALRPGNYWKRLAWLEWARSFSPRNSGGGSGRRDFLWLTVLLFLTTVLGLFLWGSKQGAQAQFIDVSLGNVPGYGVPIWIRKNFAEGRNPGINASLIGRIDALGAGDVRTFPYRQVDGQLRLPELEEVRFSKNGEGRIWSSSDTSRQPTFRGRAVSVRDPLWPQSPGSEAEIATGSLPLTLVLHRELFERHFRCEGYAEALAGTFARLEVDAQPNDPLWCIGDAIWLEAKVKNRWERTRFRVTWTDEIPAMEPVVFLIPLHTLLALELLDEAAEAEIFLEGEGTAARRIAGLFLKTPEADLGSRLDRFKSCLGGTTPDGVSIRFATARTWEQVQSCAVFAELQVADRSSMQPSADLTVAEEITSETLTLDAEGRLEFPCSLLHRKRRDRLDCEDGEMVDPYTLKDVFREAIVYVADPSDVLPKAEAIEALRVDGDAGRGGQPGRAVHLQDVYQDAITRLAFIVRVVNLLSGHYTVFFAIFLLVLFGVQIALVIVHRRFIYGVLLAKGFSRSELFWLVESQVTLSASLGLTVAICLLELMQRLLNWGMDKLLTDSRFVGRISRHSDILPISLVDYASAGILIFVMTWCLTAFFMGILCARGRDEPCQLLCT